MARTSNPREYLVELDNGSDPAAVSAWLRAARGRVTHRLDAQTIVVAIDLAPAALRAALPSGARLVTAPRSPSRAATRPGEQRDLMRAAFALRTSAAFRAAKRKRPLDGVEWGTQGLAAPDVDDDDPPPPTPRSGRTRALTETAAVPSNERLINDVAVTIVIVEGPGALKINEAERVNIVAEVQTGLDMLAGFEPDAKLTWHYALKEATVVSPPWQGARWAGMPADFYRGIDAALQRDDNGAIYFFRGDQYVKFSHVASGVDAGYPKPIKGHWKGLPASFEWGIDAAFWRPSNGAVYMFKGSRYVRMSDVSAGVDADYPKSIAENWPGLPPAFTFGIDAVLFRKDNQKLYMFKGDQYVRFSKVSDGVDPGYPKKITDSWPGLPEKWEASDNFSGGIDAALWRNSNGAVYLFKSARTVGRYVRFSNVSNGVDAEYGSKGKPIGLSTEEAEALWRDKALNALGYPQGAAGVGQMVAESQRALNAQWSFCAFMTKHTTTWPGYAGEAKLVMQASDFSAPMTGNMDRVFAHETGHVFGAPDEYGDSKCKCSELKGKFFRERNRNCALCKPDDEVSCLMRDNADSLCESTPWHLGWGAFMTGIDAALLRRDNNKLYLFSGDKYIRFTDLAAGRDAGYPADIAGNWPGLTRRFKQRVDAALWRDDNGKVYLFSGNQYVRFSKVSDGVDPGYPKPIAGHWNGMPASFNAGIDAAFWRQSNGAIYFFKGSQYLRISDPAKGMDAGYPKPIAGHWPGLNAKFNAGIDAALMRADNGKLYFFKGTQYVRFTDVARGVDPGYPAWINNNWMPFPK